MSRHHFAGPAGHIPGRITGDVLSGGKPHPRSYRPDLPFAKQLYIECDAHGTPLRAHATASLLTYVDRIVREEVEKLALDPAYVKDHLSEIPAGNKPHPRSYRPDLPMRGYTCAQLMRATKDEKAQWEGRPLAYGPAWPWPSCQPCLKCGGRASRKDDE